MKTLVEIFKGTGNHTGVDIGCNDKGSIHTYLEQYDQLLKPFQKGCTILEIGLALGHSVKLWDDYFENSTIVGVDLSIVFQPEQYKNNVVLIEADGTKEMNLPYKYDIIIDDGSHMENDQVATFNLLKDKMNFGGIYIIEDILALDQNRKRFLSLHSDCMIVDMRQNGRSDNVLIIYRFGHRKSGTYDPFNL